MTTIFDLEAYHDCFSYRFNQLDYNWFLKKKSDFEKLLSGTDDQVLTFVEEDYYPTAHLDQEIAKMEDEFANGKISYNHVQITLVDYCASFLPIDSSNGWGVFQVDGNSSVSNFMRNRYNYREVATKLLDDVLDFLSVKANIEETKRFVDKVTLDFDEHFEQFKEDSPTDTNYREVLNRFSICFKRLVELKFSKELLYNNSSTKNKLNFEMGQNALAAFCRLLLDAGVLSGDGLSVSKFAADHFCYLKKGEFQPISDYYTFSEIIRKMHTTKADLPPRLIKTIQKLNDRI
jgi:hypothetical protein